MKKHSVFNAKLYVDTLRRLRLPGFIMAAAVLVISLLPPLVMYIERFRRFGSEAAVTSISSVTPALWGYMYIGGAGLMLAAFAFLNKRNSSDFFHALPNTALCTWLSTAAAAVTWQAATVIGTVILTYLAYVVTGVSITAAFLPDLLGYFLSGTLLVSACAAIAVAITGTMLTNIVLSGLILFLPRLILAMLAVAISGYAEIVPMNSMGILFDPIYNIPCLPLAALTNVSFLGSTPSVTFRPGMAYSAVLAVVYLGLALLAYRARRSEIAEKSAPSRLLQAVYRCALTLPLLMLMAVQAAAMGDSLWELLGKKTGLFIVFWALAALVYFIYEAVTTKKFKNVLKAVPLFLALAVVVPAATWGISRGVAGAMLNHCPEAESIEGVSFNLGKSRDYNEKLTAGIVYKDAEMIGLCREGLRRAIDDVKRYGYVRHSSSKEASVRVTFKTRLGSFTRDVYMSYEEYTRLSELRFNYPEYGALARKFPSPPEIHSFSVNFAFGYSALDGTPGDSLITALREDVEALSDYEYIRHMNSEGFVSVRIYGYAGTDYFFKAVPISQKTPRALRLIISASNNEGKGLEKLDDLARMLKTDMHIMPSVSLIGEEGDGYIPFDPGRLAALIEEVKDKTDAEVDLNQPILAVFYVLDERDNYNSYNAFFNVTREQIAALEGGK